MPASMLTLSNIFMTFVWYGHLRYFNGRIWIIGQSRYCIIRMLFAGICKWD
ncbi:DMT family protein [Pectobacterium brasiliense]|uniref:DMT family protein n=1 Tax=Pectobacterium brasiliense TaxID=180957 RepID=UPI000B059E57|nr:DMT family protein [Pectobacterium brasiliense]